MVYLLPGFMLTLSPQVQVCHITRGQDWSVFCDHITHTLFSFYCPVHQSFSVTVQHLGCSFDLFHHSSFSSGSPLFSSPLTAPLKQFTLLLNSLNSIPTWAMGLVAPGWLLQILQGSSSLPTPATRLLCTCLCPGTLVWPSRYWISGPVWTLPCGSFLKSSLTTQNSPNFQLLKGLYSGNFIARQSAFSEEATFDVSLPAYFHLEEDAGCWK